MAEISANSGLHGSPTVYLTVNESSYSVEANESYLYWELKINRPYNVVSSASKYYEVWIDGSCVAAANTTIGGSGWKTIASGWKTVKHNNDGKKTIAFSFSLNLAITWDGTWIGTLSNNGSTALTNIPRSSTATVTGTLELGNELTINVSRAVNTFIHNIYVSWGSQIQNERILTGIATSGKWIIPKDYANYIPNGAEGTLFITCETYNGSTRIGDKTTSVAIKVPDTDEFKPTINSVTIAENSGSRVSKSWGIYVQNASQIDFDITAAGTYSSTIKSYSVAVNGTTYNAKTFTTDLLKTSGTNSAIVTVTDSRNRSKSYTKTFDVVAYNGPIIDTFNVNRCDEDGVYNIEGDYVKIDIAAIVPRLNDKNNYSYFLKKKKSEDDESEYQVIETTLTETKDDVNINLSKSLVVECNGDDAYDFIFMLVDSIYTSNQPRRVDMAFQLFNFNKSGKGLAIGTISKKDALEINMPIYDKFDQLIPNGLAEYKPNGEDIDPDTTLKSLILTETNTPTGGFYYIMTMFYADKSTTTNRTQIAVPYIYQTTQNKRGIYIRQNVGGTWNSWTLANAPEVSSAADANGWLCADFGSYKKYWKYGAYSYTYVPGWSWVSLSGNYGKWPADVTSYDKDKMIFQATLCCDDPAIIQDAHVTHGSTTIGVAWRNTYSGQINNVITRFHYELTVFN